MPAKSNTERSGDPRPADDLNELRRLLDRWRVGEPLRTSRPARGTNNDTQLIETTAGRYVLRRYRDATDRTRALAEHRLLAAIHATGSGLPFQVPAPLPDRDGATLVRAGEGWASLCPWLPGERPDPADLDVVRACGAAVATLDGALSSISPARIGVPAGWGGDLGAVHPLVPDPVGLALALPEAALGGVSRRWLTDWLVAMAVDAAAGPARLPVQLVHGDVALSNLLCAGGTVAAVLDFEFAGVDLGLADLVDPVLTLVNDWAHADSRALAQARAYVSGYVSVRPPTAAEWAYGPIRLRLRAVLSLLWRAGRWRAGLATPDEIAVRIRGAQAVDAQVDRVWPMLAP